ncbi:MAG: GAF domain-containing protein [Candidatus Latescibacteria bacterium]|nr:GAF domain-containing protein [Candidatus Latescibacterota bacterium]NIM21325.1 GAF domain-containing protein [Candidatus Latescibacterota bacterium]NIM65506.1 GAF domain-containing protein [Candidatus Latescibacterota bacterium]NIO01886.1 GAF domain-containing protein [Candidatus Latescibacterota bacterium]NIO28699.1 GAF domain-containing protein [Candidatus Latescibacterota bacterium]
MLSEIHKQEGIRIALIFDPNPSAVGLEIAEILQIPRFHRPQKLPDTHVDYVIVSEPRERFEEELKALAGAGASILTHSEAMKSLCGGDEEEEKIKAPQEVETGLYTIDDALIAFERLLDRKETLKFLLDVAVKAANAAAGSIMLYSKEAQELYIAYAIGLSERIIRTTRQKLGEGIAGAVAQEKSGKLIHLRHDKSPYATERERMDIASAISVPLMWEGVLLGVLNVSCGKSDPPLDESDLRTLKRLSRRISRVLSESLKFQEAQVRHREMSLRYSVGELSEKTISSREKFSLLSMLLADLVGATTAEIFISTHEGDWFVLGGSNRGLLPGPGRIMFDKGALSRCLIEHRAIILTESVPDAADIISSVSSIVFVPLALKTSLGVLVLEFSARYKLDEFMLVKDSISLEVSRFLGSVLRERRLKRELEALGKVSSFAPALLSCKSLRDLCEMTSRLVADVLECERVSIRVLGAGGAQGGASSFYEPPGERSDTWRKEDEERYKRLQEKREPFSLAFLNFAPTSVEPPPSYHSLLGVPITSGEAFLGGIIAYDKNPEEPMDDATFTELDRIVMKSLVSLIVPVVGSLSVVAPVEAPSEEAAYDELLDDNFGRLKKICENEMARSDRYHHAFSVILFRIPSLRDIFEENYQSALRLVDEISQGIQTRTRKSDYGAWIARDSYAMINLEGSRRARFLISRLINYLLRDLSTALEKPVESTDILVGVTIYPGKAKRPEELYREAEESLAPYAPE